jgi:hypothetical protein
MEQFLIDFLCMTRDSFKRKATFNWFVVVFIGFICRGDFLGVSSIIRAIDLCPGKYESLLHFFHSSAWKGTELLSRCVKWVKKDGLLIKRNGKIVINGDETKTPKEGRKMPYVGTIRQTSETSSKPSHFRGHEWAMLGVLIGIGERIFCTPAWANIMKPGISKKEESPRTVGVIKAASKLASSLDYQAYLVLDAFYAVGTVFLAAATTDNITIITRAKSNCVAHVLAKIQTVKKRGRPKIYEYAVKIKELFETKTFKTSTVKVYGNIEEVKMYSTVLFWKVAKAEILFVLAETSRGKIILMCSDINTSPVDVLELYCSRVFIEVMFERVKNLLGIMRYHFWSKSIIPQSRRPIKNKENRPSTESSKEKQKAISNFVNIGLVVLLFLQVVACKFKTSVTDVADCWLRTPSKEIPSEFIVKIAITKVIMRILKGYGSNAITKIIKDKQRTIPDSPKKEKVA